MNEYSRVKKISPSDVNLIDSNQILSIQLKDGTCIFVNEEQYQELFKKVDLGQPQMDDNYGYEYGQQSYGSEQQQINALQKKYQEHEHHKDGIGAFGHHFKTEYNIDYSNCSSCQGGIVKKRENYVLFVSKNASQSNEKVDKGNYFKKGTFGSYNASSLEQKIRVKRHPFGSIIGDVESNNVEYANKVQGNTEMNVVTVSGMEEQATGEMKAPLLKIKRHPFGSIREDVEYNNVEYANKIQGNTEMNVVTVSGMEEQATGEMKAPLLKIKRHPFGSIREDGGYNNVEYADKVQGNTEMNVVTVSGMEEQATGEMKAPLLKIKRHPFGSIREDGGYNNIENPNVNINEVVQENVEENDGGNVCDEEEMGQEEEMEANIYGVGENENENPYLAVYNQNEYENQQIQTSNLPQTYEGNQEAQIQNAFQPQKITQTVKVFAPTQ